MPASIRVRIKTAQFPQGRWLLIPPSATAVRDVFYFVLSNTTPMDDTKEGQGLLLQGSPLLMDDDITVIRDGDTLELQSCPTGTPRQSEGGSQQEEKTRCSPDSSFFKFNAIAPGKSMARSLHSFPERGTNKACPDNSIAKLPSSQNSIDQTLGSNRTPVISTNLTYFRASATHEKTTSALTDFSEGQVEQSNTISRRHHGSTQENPSTKEPFTLPMDSMKRPGHSEVLEKNAMTSTILSHEVENTKDKCTAKGKTTYTSPDPTSLSKSRRVRFEFESENYLDQNSRQAKVGPHLPSELLIEETELIDNEKPPTSKMDILLQQVSLGGKPTRPHFQPEKNEATDLKQSEEAKDREARIGLGKRSEMPIRAGSEESPLEAVIGPHVRVPVGKPPGIRKKRIRTLSVEAKRKRNARNRKREQRKRKALRQFATNCGVAKKASALLPKRTSEQYGPDLELSPDRNKKECASHNKRDGIHAGKRAGISNKMLKDPVEHNRGKRHARKVENTHCALEAEKAKLLAEIQIRKEPQEPNDEHGDFMISEEAFKDTSRDRAASKVMRHNSVASALRLARASGMLDVRSNVDRTRKAEVNSPLPRVKPGTQCNPCPSQGTHSLSVFTGKETKIGLAKTANLSKRARAYIEEEQYNESVFIGFESSEEMALPSLDLLDMLRPEDESEDVKVMVTAYDKDYPFESSRRTREVPGVAPKRVFEEARNCENSKVQIDVTGDIASPQIDLHHILKNNPNIDKKTSTTKLSLRSADQTAGELESIPNEKCTNSAVSKTTPLGAACDSLVTGTKVVSVDGSHIRNHASRLPTKQAHTARPHPSPFSQRFGGNDKRRGECSKVIASVSLVKQISCESDWQNNPDAKSSQLTTSDSQNDLPLGKPISTGRYSDKEAVSNVRECVTKRQRSRLLPTSSIDNENQGIMNSRNFLQTTIERKLKGVSAEKTTHQLGYIESGSKRRKSQGGLLGCGNQFVADQLPEKQYMQSQKCFITKDLSTVDRYDEMACETDTQLTVATSRTRLGSNAEEYLNASFRGSLFHVLLNSIDVVGKFCSGRFKK